MIRVATMDDAEGVLEIYTPFVQATAISFEYEPPPLGVMRQRISATLETHPWLVYEQQGRIGGYAYAGQHRARAAYQWSADVSVYVHSEARRGGLGRALYLSLLALLRLQGFYNAYAGITLPNPASVGLHEAVGFTAVGVYQEVGFKLGSWYDVGWWQLALRPKAPAPTPAIPFPMAQAHPEFKEAVEAGMKL